MNLKRIKVGSLIYVEEKKTNKIKRFQLGLFLSIFFVLGFLCGKINPDAFTPAVNNQTIEVQTIVEPIIKPETIESKESLRYAFTDEDTYLLALLLCGDKNIDGDGEYDIDFEKNINQVEVDKVLSVVMNRVNSGKYSNTISGIVLQPKQFSVMKHHVNKKPSEKAFRTVYEWCQAYNNYDESVHLIPDNHLYFTGNGVINTTRANWK